MGGIFGNMFDFNRDGKLDSFERTMEFGFIQSLDKEVSIFCRVFLLIAVKH